MEILCFVLCFRIVSINYMSSLARRGGGTEETPGLTFTQPRFSIRTHASQLTPSGVHFMFAGLPIVETSHLPHNPSHIIIRHTCHELSTHQYSLPSNVDFPGCILTLPTRFGLCPFEPSLPSCAISAHDPRHHLASGRTSRNPAVRFPRTTPGHHTAFGRTNRSLCNDPR
jgi:hypothetical protein